MKHTIVWFRNDLRVQDNPALLGASALGDVVALYILDETVEWHLQGAQLWWLHHSLESLAGSLKNMGIPLLLKRGNSELVFKQLIKEFPTEAVFWNRRYTPLGRKQDESISALLEHQSIASESFQSSLLFEPGSILNGSQLPYKVFTPFWKSCLTKAPKRKLFASDAYKQNSPKLKVNSDTLSDWQLLPHNPNWAKHFDSIWEPGEAGAQVRLENFVSAYLDQYSDERDRPDLSTTSKLSPHLCFGELSPFQVWSAVTKNQGALTQTNRSRQVFMSQIGWREFSYHLLYHFPSLPTHNFKKAFSHFKWSKSKTHLKAWQQGKTGYPIVDAGMRELWETGTMHNRVRMIVASFLTKHLLIPWQEGEKWFWDTLLDADLANNAASWQWVAGSGADAAPYFRIFNPVLQGEKFDPHGDYVRRWVPELKGLPNAYIHKPWLAAEALKRSIAGLYPQPIVDHKEAREQALSAYRNLPKTL